MSGVAVVVLLGLLAVIALSAVGTAGSLRFILEKLPNPEGPIEVHIPKWNFPAEGEIVVIRDTQSDEFIRAKVMNVSRGENEVFLWDVEVVED